MTRLWAVVCGVGFSGVAQAACPWEGSAGSFFRCVMDMSEVVDENQAAVAEHEGRLNAVEDALWDLSAVAVSAAEVLSVVAGEGYALLVDIAPVGLTGSFADLVDVPGGLADGDDDTLAMLVCSDGQVAVAFGGGWVCGEPEASELDALMDRVAALELASPGASSSGVLYGSYAISNSVDLAGMVGFTEITGDLTISAGLVPSLSALSSLTAIGGTLYVSDCDGLVDLDGLQNLSRVDGGVYISSNDNLTSLDGLDSLTEVGATLNVYANDTLSSVEGLGALTSVGGNLAFEYNPMLDELEGLSRLTTVGDWLKVQNNAGLLTLDGLSGLTDVGGWVQIEYNDALQSCEGLNGLVEIPGTLEVNGNPSLTALGFDSVTWVGGNVAITSNFSLCQSAIDGWLSGVTVDGDWGAPATYDNDDGC